jgi:hypothetical protein
MGFPPVGHLVSLIIRKNVKRKLTRAFLAIWSSVGLWNQRGGASYCVFCLALLNTLTSPKTLRRGPSESNAFAPGITAAQEMLGGDCEVCARP